MDFELFQYRLLQTLRMRVRNGELTERSLARLIGVSQPHVHNVLKGTRILSPEIADVILEKLGMSLLDLIEVNEFETALARNPQARFARAPLLDGFVGPGHAWPERITPGDGVWISLDGIRGLQNIAAARLAPDPQMTVAGHSSSIALLDMSEGARSLIDPDAYYAVSHDNQSYLRKLRGASSTLYLLDDAAKSPEMWVRVEASKGVTDVVRAKVLFVARPDGFSSAPHARRFLPPETSR